MQRLCKFRLYMQSIRRGWRLNQEELYNIRAGRAKDEEEGVRRLRV